MNRYVTRTASRLIAALALCLPLAAQAFSYRMMSDADLFDSADGVARARIERVLPATDGEFETRYELRVLATLAGAKLAPREILVLPGADAPGRTLSIDGVPRLSEGGEILLFHARRDDGVLQPMQLSLGLFGRELLEGRPYYVRALEGARELGKRGDTRRYHAAREPQAFERWLIDRGRGVQREPDYLQTDAIDDDGLAKFTFSTFNFTPAGPARWFQFDSSQTLSWTAGSGGQASTSFDEFASVQQALAAWTNDPNSRILLAYAGTAANPPACNNPAQGSGSFSGHVCWNDPTGRIAGSFNCGSGGVLAIGGSFASSSGQSFGGQTWYPRSDAFVIIQDGAGCFLDGNNGADGAELLTHEIGHSLAFGHACGDSSSPACNSSAVLNQATMRAFAHGDGRGAVLGTDDRAAAAVAYPMPGGGDVTPPSVPAGVAANANDNSISVTWNASTDAGTGVAGYEVERCQGAGCSNFAAVMSGPGTSYVDTGLLTSTTYRYRVRAFDMAGNRSAYSAVATATTPAMTQMPLSNGVPVTGLSGAVDSQKLFTLQVPAGATNLVIAMSGGSGDADLYVRRGAVPTLSQYDCRPFFLGNNETCSAPSPVAGLYYVWINADAAYTGVTLLATYDVPAATCTGACVYRDGFE